MIKLLIGSLISVVALGFSVIMTGASFWLYLHPPELLAVLIVPVGLMISSFGAGRFFSTVSSVFGISSAVAAERAVLKHWILATYAMGALSLLAGGIVTLCVIDQSPLVLASKISAALCAPIYALIFAEFLLRPALSRVEVTLES